MKITIEFEPNRFTRKIGGVASKVSPAITQGKQQCNATIQRGRAQVICTTRNVCSRIRNPFAKATTQ